MESSFFRTLLQKKLLIFSLLYLFALLLRLYGVLIEDPQPDEVHWQARAHNVVSRIREGDLARATTHLGQPGVPPALFMALGQVVADKYNKHQGYTASDLRYVDQLAASRVAVILVNSLLPGVVFLGLSVFLGVEFAFLVAAALSLDPMLIGLSRIAHLDALLTLFITLAFGFYAGAVLCRRERLKLIAGAFWGLAIATKPTSGALIVGFMLFNVLRYLFLRFKTGERTPILTWGDVWAFVVGHVAFATLYTRLWFHESDYLLRLGIRSRFADLLYETGKWMQLHLSVTLLALFCLGFVLIRAFRANRSEAQKNSVLLLFLIGLSLLFVPQVLENIVRYWTWASGLKGMSHQSYGHIWSPPKYGYWAIVFSRLPDLILSGFILGVSFLVFGGAQKETGDKKPAMALPLLAFSLVVSGLWVLPLSVSPKQTFRYVLPVLPLVYLISVFGLVRAAKFISQSLPVRARPRALSSAVTLMFVALVGSLFSATPDYQLYFNTMTGGLEGALARGHNLPAAGQNEVVRFLHAKLTEEGQKAKVLVMGDPDSLNLVYQRLYRSESERILKFVPFDRFSSHGRFVVRNVSFNPTQMSTDEDLKNFAIFEGLSPRYTYSVGAVPLTSVYEIPLFDGHPTLFIDPVSAPRGVGRRQALGEGLPTESGKRIIKAVIVDKGEKGFILIGVDPLAAPGNYLTKFQVTFPLGFIPPTAENSPKLVLRLDVGRDCERVVRKEELQPGEFREIRLSCEHKVTGPLRIRVYWFGNLPALIGPMEVAAE